MLSYEDSGPRLAHRFTWYAAPDAWAHVRRARGAAPLREADPDRRDSGPSAFWRPWWDAVADFGAGLVVIDPASVAAAGLSPSDGAAVRAFLLGVTEEAARSGAGSGQWHDGARAVLHLSGAGPDDKRLIVAAKSNYGPSGWGARLSPRWDRDTWRGLTLDTGQARLTRQRVADTRKEWAKAPKPDTSEKRGNGEPYAAPGEV